MFEINHFSTPEEKKSQKTSFVEIFDTIRDSLKNSIDLFINEDKIEKEQKSFEELDSEIDKYIEVEEKFDNIHQESIATGREVAAFYRSLIPKSLRQPEKQYEDKVRQSKFELYGDYGGLQEQLRLAKCNFHQENDFKNEELNIVSQQNNLNIVNESPIKNGIFQQAEFRSVQNYGTALIEEDVNNLLSAKINIASSDLVWRNIESGKKLDLTQLLPIGFQFIPGVLRNYEKVFDKNKGEIMVKFIPTNLKIYHGTKGSEGRFYQASDMVAYGDLTKKGGLLSLLHEISHSWQSVYYQEFGVEQFQKIEDGLVYYPEYINKVKGDLDSGKISQDQFKDEVEIIKKLLAKVNVEIEESRFLDAESVLRDDEQKFIDPISGSSFIIKSDKLERVIRKYESDERDAWAHAIKVLRFLRSKGIDLEPELKTIDDFKQVIDPCLETYQKHIGGEVELGSGKVRFIRE